MYIIYTKNGKYASAAVSKRTGKKTSVSYTYLGTVIDKEKGIYLNSQRGVFTFDPKTNSYGTVPESFVPPLSKDGRKNERLVLDFGDAFFTNAFLHQSGLMDVVDSIGYGNPDTMHAMLLFYMLSSLSNCNAQIWYEGSVTKLLFPKANLSSQRISDFLRSIGNPEKQLRFQKAYIDFILKHYNPDKNILIDSSGLPNGIHMPLTAVNNHNGKVSNEVRLVFVVQKSTGIPLYFQAVPGNLVDSTTLQNILLHLESLGINIESCILDAGYNTGANLDTFYDENHNGKVNFITRITGNDSEFTKMIREELDSLDCKENFVKYGDRYLFIKKKKIFVGTKRNNPAWLYLGLDCSRVTDESKKLWRRAFRNNMTKDDVYNALSREGLFGVISSKEFTCEEILPAYYQRQAAEQIFDFAKNYTKLLPLRTQTEETFPGHLLLSYIASCAVKMMQLKLKSTDMLLESRLACMRNQKCTVYEENVVIGYPQKDANDTYKAFRILSPNSLPLKEGILQYVPPKADDIIEENHNRQGTESQQNGASINPPAPVPTDVKHDAKDSDSTKSKATNNPPALDSKAKRGRGRPKGSKNKATLEKERLLAEAISEGTADAPVKRGRGRPQRFQKQDYTGEEKTFAQKEEIPTQTEKRGADHSKDSRNKSTSGKQKLPPQADGQN